MTPAARHHLALLARKAHTRLERGVRAALRLAAAAGASADQLAEIEHTTRERLVAQAEAELEVAAAALSRAAKERRT